MGCGSTEIKLEGQVIKQETIYLDIMGGQVVKVVKKIHTK